MWVETVKHKIAKYKLSTIKVLINEDDGKETL